MSSAGNALSLRQAVLDLRDERRTGVLELMAEGVRTRIYFEHGRPVFAEATPPGDTFGRLLVALGSISNDQLARVIDEMKRAGKADEPLPFGEVAVGLGVATQEQVERGLTEYLGGIMSRAFAHKESQWAFDASPAAAKPPRSFSLEIDPALLESMQRPPEASGAAEQPFEKGVALLRAGQMAPAAIELRRACSLRPESLEYQLYATWAEARSRGDVPSEADQKALLDVAHRAKKRDPSFAFAAYVIGQLSMWAGDDGSAKKWFYEALRLDPKSEAVAQVRILARRGTGPSGLSGLWKLPDADPPAERPPVPAGRPPVPAGRAPVPGGPPPVPVSAPPAQAAKVVRPSSAASPGRWTERLALIAGVLAAFGFAAVFAATRSASRAGTAPSATAQPAPSAGVALPVALQPREPPAPPSPPPDDPGAGAIAGDPEPEMKSPDSTTEKGPDDGEEGTLLFPSRAAGHRVFVDGRRVDADGSAPLRLPCGPHVIQVGGHGAPEHIDVPCRGAIQLD